VAVSTSAGALHDPNGLEVDDLLTLTAEHGDDAVHHYHGRPVLRVGAELAVDCDVLVPAARQDVIDTRIAGDVTAKLVVEGANLPASQDALAILADRKILVVPDFVANAGGIVAAGVAMEARYSPFRPDAAAIRTLVANRIRANTADVLDEADASAALPHDAARRIAQTRVRAAMAARGQLKTGAHR
jgi:glutamate dehydrogenase (NAD(P)+)